MIYPRLFGEDPTQGAFYHGSTLIPCTLFKTQNRMDDHNAKDMQCGDLSEAQLKSHFHLYGSHR